MTFLQHLHQVRKDIFEAAFDEFICGFATVNDLAGAAGLAWTTVDNLYRGVTKEPRYSTIRKLAIAVKMDLKLMDEALGVEDVKPSDRQIVWAAKRIVKGRVHKRVRS